MIFLSAILFFFAVFICFYIPGTVTLTLLKIKRDRIEDIILSLCLGLSVFLLFSYIFAWMQINFLIWLVLASFFAIYVLKRKSTRITNSQIDLIPIIFIIIGSICYTALTLFSGWEIPEGLQFIGVNEADGLVHIARIKNFATHFPPLHPGLAEVEFRGYHYFYDFLLSQFHSLFRFDVFDLYFRHFSFFISLLFGLAFLLFARINKLSRLQTWLIIILAYFTPGFIVIPNILLSSSINLSILVPSNYIFDPSMVLSIALLIVGLASLPKSVKSFQYAIIIGVILGVLSQVKIYAGLIGIITICLYGLYTAIRTKKLKHWPYIFMGVLTAILTALTFLPNNLGSGSFVFLPFLFYEHFIKQGAFDKNHWELKRQIFLEHNNIPRIIILYIQATGLFFLYAIGIKLLVLLQIFSLRKKRFWLNDSNIILFISIASALLIPTFFIQSVSVFDIGQFFAVAILLLSIPAAGTICWVFAKNKIIGVLLIGVVIVLSFLEMRTVLMRYVYPQNPYVVTNEERKLYSYVSQQIPPTEFLVSIPVIGESNSPQTIIWYKPSLVSAMTGRPVYIEDEIIQNPNNARTRKNREYDIDNLSEYILSCSRQDIVRKLKKIESQYVVTQKPENCLKNISSDFRESQSVSFYKIDY